jgi:hypothetical protein
VSLKVNDILHSLAEVGLLECTGHYISKLVPSMSKADRRQNALNLLNELKLVHLKTKLPIKVYDAIAYENGNYRWKFTPEYILFYKDAGIWLPKDADEGLKKYMETYGDDC